jgi:hypothetical protein
VIFVDRTLDPEGCVKMLEDNKVFDGIRAAFTDKDIHFEQHGSAHRASKARDLIRGAIDRTEESPADSPDSLMI